MMKIRHNRNKGFTVVEMAIASVASVVVVIGVGVLLVDSQNSFNRTYAQAYSDIVVDNRVVDLTFQSIVRKADRASFDIDPSGQWIEVSYYSSDAAVSLDRYARFYVLNGSLMLEYGELDPKSTLDVQTICSGVSGCQFISQGASIHDDPKPDRWHRDRPDRQLCGFA